jgi:DNA invertase Pin-like site-specific DNA recombinase
MLLKVALQIARDDYETRRERQRQGIEIAGRVADTKAHERIIALRKDGHSIAETARLAGTSPTQVKRVWARHK